MPKENKIQASFLAGEISKQVYGRVDIPQYDQALAFCQNYLPLIQGPLLRRPGTIFAAQVKNSFQMPTLFAFKFSNAQNFILEMGETYVRFYQNEAQIITATNSFAVHGTYNELGSTTPLGFDLHGVRSDWHQGSNELIYASSIIPAGSVLELYSPYHWADVNSLKYTQKQDTVYFTHPSYPPYKLVRTGINTWDFKQLATQDGPYLPLNSYQTIADNANVYFNVINNPTTTIYNQFVQQYWPGYFNASGGEFYPNVFMGSSFAVVQAAPVVNIASIVPVSSTLATIQTASINPPFYTGNKVFLSNILNSSLLNCEYNNLGGITGNNFAVNSSFYFVQSSAPTPAYWVVDSVAGTTTINIRSTFPIFRTNQIGSTATYMPTIQPAIFQLLSGSSVQYWADVRQQSSSLSTSFYNNVGCMRPMGLYLTVGSTTSRYNGWITGVINAGAATVIGNVGQSFPQGSSFFWALGVYNYINGFPNACGFHQDRLILAGPTAFPQEIDASVTSQYEVFSASGSTAQVTANNALQFNLNSQDLNQIQWVLSGPLGLFAGTLESEWAITAGGQGSALSPTNIQANQVTAFGCANVQPLFVSNALIYVQRAQRKVRELIYFWQVGSFRSTNLSKNSQHITAPQITKIVSQKEPHAFVWGVRTDGVLTSLTYDRDDLTSSEQTGWSKHILGGNGGSKASAPVVNSIDVIPSGDGTYDELWLSVQRFINGTTVGTIEYMQKPFDDYQPQESACFFDCATTHNSSVLITGISIASSCVVTAPNHGFANSSTVRFFNIQGLNISYYDINGVLNSSNPLNEQTFVIQSATTNQFYLYNFLGKPINTNSCSIYVGSGTVNMLVSSISGINYLANETVGIVADGGIAGTSVISSAGVLTLNYPAAIVNFGYPYNSDGQMLRTRDGSAQGTSIGSTRRVARVAFMLHNVGDFSFGNSFAKLIPMEIINANVGIPANTQANQFDLAPPLFDGIYRDGIESEYGFTDTVVWRQSSGLPGMVQAVTRFLEEEDV